MAASGLLSRNKDIILFDSFENHVKRRPTSTALVVDDAGRAESFTWSELASLVDRTAGYLKKRLVTYTSEKTYVGYRSGNTLDDILLTLSCAKIGAVNVPLNQYAGDKMVEACWDRIDGLWIETIRESQPPWRSFIDSVSSDPPARVDPFEPALILWTSGTSGTTKGVVLSHASLKSNAAAKLAAVPQTCDDVRLTCLSLAHAYARTCDLGTWLLSGCTLALTYGFDGWNRLAPIVKPTIANVVPSIAERLLGLEATTAGLERLRVLGVGGAGLSEQAFEAWKSRGVVVTQGYGCSETAPVICSATPNDARANLVGKPVQGWQTDIRDGRLFVKGEHLMIGYFNDPEATKAKIDPDGWFDTGDLVEVDDLSQQYRILGRTDEVIVLPNGHKIFPTTIERLVNALANVEHSMLRYDDGRLQLWLDLKCESDFDLQLQIENTLQSQPHWARPRSIDQFSIPLSIDEGELTPKGTLCRSRIEKNRFRHHR
ncbi:Long-chain-fatty-acid--CoA ligase [Novipirellula aureliae]|uniref:Long-chain-fatty-acid--CoA ligase n=1 Tax=Novipirellula aureliae TaxID=2527966 RepID=A0A5C6EB93_9BACT|nr:class I adenylate-forming enzyme family protein [Novipirellula aureliae]TWU45764.1 Long-chain-fatty-acid--CoA ligase [Novipirellula aureliae]